MAERALVNGQRPVLYRDITECLDYEIEACNLRYKGTKYKDIAKIISENEKYKVTIKPHTVKIWFSEQGILYKAYRQFVERKIEIDYQNANDKLRRGAVRAVERILEIIETGKGSLVSLEASKEVLNRTLGKPEDTLKLKANVNVAVVDVLRVINEIENGNRQIDTNNIENQN